MSNDYQPVMQVEFEETKRQIETYLQNLMNRVGELEAKAEKPARKAQETKDSGDK